MGEIRRWLQEAAIGVFDREEKPRFLVTKINDNNNAICTIKYIDVVLHLVGDLRSVADSRLNLWPLLTR